jgi:hypothetical protein
VEVVWGGFVDVVDGGRVVVVRCDVEWNATGPQEKELWTKAFPFGHIHAQGPSTHTAPAGSRDSEQAEQTVLAVGVQLAEGLNPGSQALQAAQVESALDWHAVR